MEYRLVESSAELAELLAREAGADAVMVDTEFMRQDTFFPQAALVQLCFGGTAWLLDPLAIDDLEPLAALLRDPAVTKVLHSASEDLEVFQRLLGEQPLPLFDTQRAAAFAGMAFGLGYRALVEQVCGVEISKEETRSDWLKRPLRERQLEYAALDVIHLGPVYRHLDAILRQRDMRDWVLEDGLDAVNNARGEPAPAYMRFKSAGKLGTEQLGVLVRLSEWREQRAIALDKPRNWILHDKVLQQMAERPPRSAGALRAIEGMPAAVLRKQGERLLELVQAGVEDGAAGRVPALSAPLGRSQRDALKRVKSAGRDLAGQWQVAPEALLPAKDYELLVREGAGDEISVPARWQGWRRERLIDPLRRVAAEVA